MSELWICSITSNQPSIKVWTFGARETSSTVWYSTTTQETTARQTYIGFPNKWEKMNRIFNDRRAFSSSWKCSSERGPQKDTTKAGPPVV